VSCPIATALHGRNRRFEALAARDAEAKVRGVMLLPSVGFESGAPESSALTPA
jgi:hypothetical protein